MTQMTDNTPNPSPVDTGDFYITLFNRIKNFFQSPVFPGDEDLTRRTSLLNSFLIAVLVLTMFFSIAVFFTSSRPLIPVALIAVIQVIMIVGLVYLRRGFFDQVSRTVIISLWVFVAVLSTVYGVIINPTIPIFVVVLFAAGIIISTRFAVPLTILTIFYIGAYLVLQTNSILPQLLQVRTSNFVLTTGLNIILAIFFIYITNRTTNQALDQLRNTRQELLGKNEELTGIQKYLEETVAERTQQLEKRNRYLEAAAQVASQSLSTLNLQEMLNNIAMLIADQFNFYHVGIFLLDDAKEWAVLRAVSSAGGQQMLARSHRLEVGRKGIVGYVTSVGMGRISQDIEQDRIHSTTDELPDTRAEMALPLKTRGEIIGALDIQDSNPNAFTDDDIPVLQTVADQIALAVENIKLYQQAQESLEEIQKAYGEYSQQAWIETYKKNLLRSYRYSGGIVEPLKPGEAPSILEDKVSIPILVRGFNIGAIEISKGENRKEWSEEELKLLQDLSDQLGIALDSARLYNETQLRASTQHVISEISSDLWETLEINSILKTAAEKLRNTLSVPEVTVRMAKPTAAEPSQEQDAPLSEFEEEIEE